MELSTRSVATRDRPWRGSGEDEAGQWAESLALAYIVYNRG
jgi:hypothetical protein